MNRVVDLDKPRAGPDPRVVRRALIVLGVFAASLMVLLFPEARRLALPVGVLLLGLGALAVFVKQPALGLVAFVVLSLAMPISVGTGTQTAVPISVILVGPLVGLAIGEALRRRSLRIPSPLVVVPLGALILVASLSFLVGQLPWYPHLPRATVPAQLAGLAVFYASASVFFLAAHWIRSLIWLKRLTWIFIGMASIYVLGRLIPPLGSVTTMTLPTGAAGSMVWTWLVALAFGQAVYNRGLGGWLRLLLLGVVLATFFIHSAQVQGWASGWVPALVAVLVVLWLLTPRLALVMTIVGMVIVGFNLESFLNLLLKGNQYSYETRLEAWRILLHMVRVNPLLGLGPANYYSYAPGFPILGFSVRFSSHNNYIDLIAQTGYLGLACFVWFATAMGVLCRRIIRRVPSGFAKAYAYGALGGLAGTLVSGMLGDWFLPFVYNVGIDGLGASLFAWLFMGGLVALGRLVLTREESLAPTPDLA